MSEEKEVFNMVDITMKKASYRKAVAKGRIRLRKETLNAIISGKVIKGDVLTVAKISAILAAKKTSEFIPGCHPILLTHMSVGFRIEEDGVTATCEVTSESKTGVEMEALTGVALALLTVWDMVKEMEKDENGQYPYTTIENIVVEKKVREE